MKNYITFLARLLLTLLILIFIFNKVEWELGLQLLNNISYVPIYLTILLSFINSLIISQRFITIASEPKSQISFLYSFHITLRSTFINLVMPSGSGSDATRLWYTRKIIPIENLVAQKVPYFSMILVRKKMGYSNNSD